MRKKIVFDLGGVLVDWNPRYLYREVFSDPDEMEFFLTEICTPEWNAQMDLGKPFQQAVEELVSVHPDYHEPIQMYNDRWVEMVRGAIPGTVKILEELKQAGFHLAALSNWSAETFPRVQERFHFLDWFSPLLLSGRVGVAKPASNIYRLLLAETGWQPAECLFIDDIWENIQEASRQGWDTIHFQSPAQLRAELSKQGLLPSQEKG